MTIFLVIVYLATFVWLARHAARHEGYYSTIVVFGIGAALYYVAIPTELYVTNQETIQVNALIVTMPIALCNEVILQATIALIAFYAGLLAIHRKRPLSQPDVLGTNQERRPIAFVLLAFVCWGFALIVFPDTVLYVSTYEGSYVTRYANPVFSVLPELGSVALAIFGAYLIQGDRPKFVAALSCIAPPIAWSFYSSTKSSLLLSLLALGAYFSGRRSSRSYVLALALAGSALVVLFLPVFSKYRSGQDLPTSFLDYNFSFSITDPGGPMLTLADAMTNTDGYKLGGTYMLAGPLLVPRAMWPNRPLDLAEDFAQRTIYHWKPGLGQGYSLMAEAYVNFGALGPLIQYFLLGAAWAWLRNRAAGWLGPTRRGVWIAIYYTIGYYLLIVMHRSTVAFFLKTIVQYTAVLTILMLLDQHLLALFRRRQTPSSVEGAPEQKGVGA